MPQTSVIFGLAMCALTVFGMVGSPEKLATAFIPMMLGIPLVFCGIVSLNPHRKKSWMWVAGMVAVAGLLASFSRLVVQMFRLWGDEWVNRFSLGLLWGVFGLCLVYLVILALDMWRNHCRRRGLRRTETQTKPPTAESPAAESPAAESPAAESPAADETTPDQLAVPPRAPSSNPNRQQSVSSSLGA